MVGCTLASAAPTPGGVGAVEVPAAIAVPSVLLSGEVPERLACTVPQRVLWAARRFAAATAA
jgi:hypothetical protein